MKSHTLKLATEPFQAIVSGRKTIESRLYDDKRQTVQLGDTIVFVNRNDASQTISARVIGLLRYRTFAELFQHNDPRKFDGNSVDWLLNQINQFYNAEDQQRYGVIGVEFVLM